MKDKDFLEELKIIFIYSIILCLLVILAIVLIVISIFI